MVKTSDETMLLLYLKPVISVVIFHSDHHTDWIQHLQLRLGRARYFLESCWEKKDVVKVKNLDNFVDIFGTERGFEEIQGDLWSWVHEFSISNSIREIEDTLLTSFRSRRGSSGEKGVFKPDKMQLTAVTMEPYEKITVLLESTGGNTTYKQVYEVPLMCWRPNFSRYLWHFLLIYFPDSQKPAKIRGNLAKFAENQGKPSQWGWKIHPRVHENRFWENSGSNLVLNGCFDSILRLVLHVGHPYSVNILILFFMVHCII